MIPNLKINYNVLKEPICRGKCKKIKLKLNINICQISQHCLLCVFFGKAGPVTAHKRSLWQSNVFAHMSVIRKGSASGGGSAYRGIDWADLRPPQPEKWEVCILLECFLVPKNTAHMLIQNFHACHFCEGVRNNTST